MIYARPNPQRLELTWIGKENRPRLEPRILLEESTKSYHAKHRTNNIFNNRLIFGDNLLALKVFNMVWVMGSRIKQFILNSYKIQHQAV